MLCRLVQETVSHLFLNTHDVALAIRTLTAAHYLIINYVHLSHVSLVAAMLVRAGLAAPSC